MNTRTDCVAITGLVNIESVVEYRDRMLAEIAGKTRVAFDLETLELDGSAVIALLVDVLRAARKTGVDVEYQRCSPQLMRIAAVNGVDNILPLHPLS